ncbi:MAG: ATP-binding protein [Kiritimatiellae bacterium]|nr:ATP-binding protein [Kiritimatiellia bacterium]
MRFFGRAHEIEELRKIRKLARSTARMTVVTGRRRIGKTELIRQALDDGETPFVYFLITRAPQSAVCENLQREIARAFGRPLPGRIDRFADLFRAVLEKAETTPLTLVVDEFQEFDRTAPEVYGEVAGVWDELHTTSCVNLIFCGSVNRLMHKVFFSYAEPLYGRNTGRLDLKPFPVSTLKEIFTAHAPGKSTHADLLDLWTMTGGVARYVELFMDTGAFTRADMLKTVFGTVTTFVDEGKTLLVEEFGRDYGTYFSILAGIAGGNTTFSDLKNLLGFDVGGYLTKLERDYSIVSQTQPIFEKTRNKNCHYRIDDCFFRFWFRFIYRNQSMIELGRFRELRNLARRDIDAFSGYALERYFLWKFTEETSYTRMGGWWDRKGENEIDLVCEDAIKNRLDFYEVKRDSARLDMKALKSKSEAFFAKNPGMRERKSVFKGLSLADM